MLDGFISKSCSEIEYALQNTGGAISMLCAKEIGGTDFREYNTLILPYCTQDVHLGDSVQYYDGEVVRHVGAHNVNAALEWVYANFRDLTHIFLTGCSAGGTAVPIAYDLLQRHYNSFVRGAGVGMKSVDIGIVMDSSVYLTPEVFLESSIGNWGVESVMKKIGFNFDKVRILCGCLVLTLDVSLRCIHLMQHIYSSIDTKATIQTYCGNTSCGEGPIPINGALSHILPIQFP